MQLTQEMISRMDGINCMVYERGLNVALDGFVPNPALSSATALRQCDGFGMEYHILKRLHAIDEELAVLWSGDYQASLFSLFLTAQCIGWDYDARLFDDRLKLLFMQSVLEEYRDCDIDKLDIAEVASKVDKLASEAGLDRIGTLDALGRLEALTDVLKGQEPNSPLGWFARDEISKLGKLIHNVGANLGA